MKIDSLRTIFNHDCRNMHELPDNSIQCVVTSPPYWGLRKYAGEQDLIWGNHNGCEHEWVDKSITYARGTTNTGGQPNVGAARIPVAELGQQSTCLKCGVWRGSYGLEPTPELYIAHTIEILNEIKRVLRSDGCLFLNIGDSYFGSQQGYGTKNPTPKQAWNTGTLDTILSERKSILNSKHEVLKPKDLCLIPFRVAIAAQEAGWWVRSVIIWSKNNPMPESVKDRPTESHEYILLLTKSSKYYWDIEAVREKSIDPESYTGRRWRSYSRDDYSQAGVKGELSDTNPTKDIGATYPNRNLRSVWTFPTQGYPEAHFATFPEELPERCIKAGTPEYGCCDKCGTPYERIVERKSMVTKPSPKQSGYATHGSCNICGTVISEPESKTLGWQQACKCADSKPIPQLFLAHLQVAEPLY